ncbi:hypothetical protein TanjilG_14092 [Lupinus angustifolius]|uniref:Uncharacterized protein n=1 Tax=Lupinus angustifolius TaxID=3871 RepID=A0A1J7H6L6_LUPAN|nr:hypothetical protein TanjilG_14092 [Lupinus angustifolius]
MNNEAKKKENTKNPSSALEKQLSFEEPKTLSTREMDKAREEAFKIFTTHSKEEAMKIFTKGLQPVTISKEANADIVASDSDEEWIGIWKAKA